MRRSFGLVVNMAKSALRIYAKEDHLRTFVEREGRHALRWESQSEEQILHNKIITGVYDNQSRGKVWGNDGRLCGRGVEETIKEMTKDGTSGSTRLTDRGFARIRWGICRRHTNQPTAFFYGPQFSCASIPGSFTTSLHPLIPYFHGPTRCGCDVLIYISVHVCVHHVYVSMCEVLKLLERLQSASYTNDYNHGDW